MNNMLRKFITKFSHDDKSLIVLPSEINGVSFTSQVTAIRAPIRIASESLSLMFIISNEINKIFFKTMR